MSTHIPGRHIDGMIRAFGHDPSMPPGWTRETSEEYRAYRDDADGGRAPYREQPTDEGEQHG